MQGMYAGSVNYFIFVLPALPGLNLRKAITIAWLNIPASLLICGLRYLSARGLLQKEEMKMQEEVKRSYKKPEIFKVKLTPEEAVLSGCKQGGSTGKPEYGYRCQGQCASDIGS